MDGAWTCERCGAEAPPDAQRCRNCGAWLAAYDEGQDSVTRGWRRHWPGTVFARPKPPPPPPPPDIPPPPRWNPPVEPEPEPEPQPPLPVGTLQGTGSVEGVARNVQLRTEVRGSGGNTGTVIVCNFRVEVYDRRGRPVRLVPVEMRGDSFEGAVNEGDRVRAEGKARRGTLRVKRLYNQTTGAEVSTGGTHWVVALLVLLVFAAWMIFIFFFAGR
ncbi:hypothetical protein GCM10010449_39180 [Streptomyces rectiviolaceus]|uniref:RanBP2-type domain-containing protein n=1 Tax=Streptomyces rectiviolaceus TaxID=332591 RepID=A0ABP6MKR4_9ACTN